MESTTTLRPTTTFEDDDGIDDDSRNDTTIKTKTTTAVIVSLSSSSSLSSIDGVLDEQQPKQLSSSGSPSTSVPMTTKTNDESVYSTTVFGMVGVVVAAAIIIIGYAVQQGEQSKVVVSINTLLEVGKTVSLPVIGIQLGTLLIYFFVVYNSIWLLSMILSIGFEDVYTMTANTLWRQQQQRSSSDDKPSSARADRTVAERPTTIGYNQQIQLLSGIVMYSTALLLLVYSDQTRRSSVEAPVVGTSSWSETNPIVVVTNNTLFPIRRFDGTDYNKDLLLHVIGIIGIYTVFEYVWMPFLTSYGDFRARTLHGLQWLESTVLVPIVVLTAFLVQDPLELCTFYNIDPSIVYNTIRTVLYGWIVFKLINFSYHYITNHRTIRISDYPPLFEDTPVTQKRRKIAQGDDVSMVDYTTTIAGTNEAKDIWNIYGKQYDVAAFVPYHPGGVESIMLAANRDDATALFQSYHPFNMKKARAVLEKYRIDSKDETTTSQATTPTPITTTIVDTKKNKKTSTAVAQYGHEEDIFYDVLCQRVAKVLQHDYNIHPVRDRGANYIRLISYACYLTVALYAFYKHCQGSIVYSIVFAVFGDICGAHIGHDGGHFAISSKYPRINDIGIWAFFIVTNPITWQHQHTFAHHSFTNHEDKDPDLHHFKGGLKLRPNEVLGDAFMKTGETFYAFDKERKYSYYLLMFMYSQIAIVLNHFSPWVFVMDRSYYGVVGWSDRRQWHRTIQLVTHWVLYLVVIVVVPYMAHAKTNPWMGIGQTLIHMTVSSMIFAFLTQVGHISDVALNNDAIAEQRVKRHPLAQNSWAAEQIVTTQDFAPQSPLMFVLGGGLSLQIEHHLFPGFNHCHLTKIQPIVESTCQEYNVTYTKYETWYDAWNVTVNYLTQMNNKAGIQ